EGSVLAGTHLRLGPLTNRRSLIGRRISRLTAIGHALCGRPGGTGGASPEEIGLTPPVAPGPSRGPRRYGAGTSCRALFHALTLTTGEAPRRSELRYATWRVSDSPGHRVTSLSLQNTGR